jgi:hypothetical protein
MSAVAENISRRTDTVLRRAYLEGHLAKPLEHCTDKELLLIPVVGKKTLPGNRTLFSARKPCRGIRSYR